MQETDINGPQTINPVKGESLILFECWPKMSLNLQIWKTTEQRLQNGEGMSLWDMSSSQSLPKFPFLWVLSLLFKESSTDQNRNKSWDFVLLLKLLHPTGWITKF